jgi:hypothetical protein
MEFSASLPDDHEGGKPQESEAFFALLTDIVEKPVDRAGPETNYLNFIEVKGQLTLFCAGALSN